MIDPVITEVVNDYVTHETGMTVKAPKLRWPFPVPQSSTLSDTFKKWATETLIRKLLPGDK